MQQLEKHKTWMILGLAALTIAGFIALRGPAATAVGPTETTTAPVDETTSGNCGLCNRMDGTQVSCYIPTQKYTCSSKAVQCATPCV